MQFHYTAYSDESAYASPSDQLSEPGIMPIYTFELRDGDRKLEDGNGVDLPDRDHAFHYALDVAHDLMSCREAQTRSWCLDVYDGNGQRAFELPFARIDPTLDHLARPMRETAET